MRTAFVEIRLIGCKSIAEREDGNELLELENRIHSLLVHMNKLVLEMLDDSVEELEICDIDIEWQEVFNKDGTEHSWFEMVDGVKHLRFADKVGEGK